MTDQRFLHCSGCSFPPGCLTGFFVHVLAGGIFFYLLSPFKSQTAVDVLTFHNDTDGPSVPKTTPEGSVCLSQASVNSCGGQELQELTAAPHNGV